MYVKVVYAWYGWFLCIGILIGIIFASIPWGKIIRWFILIAVDIKEERKKNSD